MKVLRYTIKTVVEFPANEPEWLSEVQSILDKGQELGTSEIIATELVDKEENPIG